MTDLARVLPFEPKSAPTKRPRPSGARTVVAIRRRPARRQPTNGHTADCPYPNTNPQHCGICASERKANQ